MDDSRDAPLTDEQVSKRIDAVQEVARERIELTSGQTSAKQRGGSRVTFADERREKREVARIKRRLERSDKWNEKFLEALFAERPIDPKKARLHLNLAMRIAGPACALGLDARKAGVLTAYVYDGLIVEIQKATSIVIGEMRAKVVAEEMAKHKTAKSSDEEREPCEDEISSTR